MKRRILAVFAGIAALLSTAALPPTVATAELRESLPGCLDVVDAFEGTAGLDPSTGNTVLPLRLTLRSAACPEDADYRVVVLDAKEDPTAEAPLEFTPSGTDGAYVNFVLEVPATHVRSDACVTGGDEVVSNVIWAYATTRFTRHTDIEGGPRDRAPDVAHGELNFCGTGGSAAWN